MYFPEVTEITSQLAHYYPGGWENSEQRHIFITLFTVADVSKTRQNQSSIMVREEMKSKH